MKGKKWLLTWVIGLCMIFACAIGFTACGKGKSAGKFSAGKVSQIELGMTQKQVRDIIGKPDDSDESGYTYYWYEDKIKNLLAEIEKEENEWDEDDFEEDLDDFGKDEDVIDRLDQLYTQLEEMTFKFIMVTFSGDEKVTSVYLDCEHIYDEGSDYSSAREKTVKNVRLDVDKVEVATGKLYTFDGETTTEEETLHIITKVSNVKYSTEFNDGSYIKRTTTPRCLGLTDDKKQAKYQWSDMLAQYDVQIGVNVQEGDWLVVTEGVTTISSNDVAEYADKVNMISLPSTLVEIGKNAFTNFNGVTEIVIPDSVTSIGGSAFYDCGGLTEIIIPDSVTSIGEDAFSYCRSLTRVTFGENSQLTSIGDYAFYDCDSLTEIVIPDSVTSVGGSAFYDCNRLTEIVIPDSVTSIGDSAFSGCSSLENIKVEENNKAYKDIDGNLYTKDGTTLIQYAIGKTATSFTIHNGVTSIGETAFYYCSSLTEVVIPDGITSIGDSAFRNCSSLTSITFNGTMEQWNNVTKGRSWDYFVSATEVVCSDGEVTL